MARGRPRKKNDLDLPDLPETPIEGVINAQPVQKKSVVKTERWTEVAAKTPVQRLFEEEEPEYIEPTNPLDIVMDDFTGGSDGGYIKVYRLPEYVKKGTASPRNALREFCGNFPVTPDYENLIKDQCGAGVYHLDLRAEDGSFLRAKTIAIAGPAFSAVQPGGISRSGGPSQNPTAVNSAQMGGIPYDPPDPMKQVEASLELITKMRKAFGAGETPNGAVAQPQANPPLTPEMAFMHLASQSEETMSRIEQKFKALLRPDSAPSETTVNDLILAAINIFPQVFDRAEALITRVINAKGVGVHASPQMEPQTIPANQTVPNHTTGWTPPQAPNGPAQTAAEITRSVPPADAGATGGSVNGQVQGIDQQAQVLNFVMSELLKALQRNEHMIPVVNFLITQEQQHPDIVSPLMDEFTDKSADEILEILNVIPEAAQYTGLPHSRVWIENLQKALKEATEPEAAEGDTPNV